MTRHLDTIAGAAATVAGSVGLTVQMVTEFASLVVVGLNILLAMGGLYLLWLRIKKARRDS
ncbi:MAG: hypothetical protein VW338_05030 [Rhodospirillaceae bacterium]